MLNRRLTQISQISQILRGFMPLTYSFRNKLKVSDNGNTQSVEKALETIHDLEHLTELFRAALRIPTIEDFLEAIKQ